MEKCYRSCAKLNSFSVTISAVSRIAGAVMGMMTVWMAVMSALKFAVCMLLDFNPQFILYLKKWKQNNVSLRGVKQKR